MADEKLPYIAEDNDLERAKAFWRSNGTPIIVGVLLGLGAIVGYKYWQDYVVSQSEQASLTYERFVTGERSQSLVEELKQNSIAPVYAQLAAFNFAKDYVENNELDKAASELTWIIENSKALSFVHVARLRLASVLLAQGDADAVLSMLKVEEMSSFQSRYYELLGDAYSLRADEGDVVFARESYEASMRSLIYNSDYARVLQLKLDKLGDL